MTRQKKLPIGVQTFSEIRKDNYYYVDKTEYAVSLADDGKYYFLSRPRRFGKSLLIDTFRALFSGEKELFVGLHAEKNWDWSTVYPVLTFSFAGGTLQTREDLEDEIADQLSMHEKAFGLPNQISKTRSRFRHLIRQVSDQAGCRVVILVDEYDKPILDVIENQEIAKQNRNVLRDFYSVIKDNDAYIRFAFLTGVSKFTKAGIFSGLNNLMDITINAKYSAVCGYTESDLDIVFAPELEGVDRKQVRRWYNGYNWTGEKVYNPFDILLFFTEKTISPYWFETGTPTFLIHQLLKQKVFSPNLSRRMASEILLSSFDVDNMPLEALLFQTGYLTICTTRMMGGRRQYTLGYPNLEVQSALNEVLLKTLIMDPSEAETGVGRLYDALSGNDVSDLEAHFKALFASIPHDWHRKNRIADYEGYYASIFYSHFAALGLDIRVEDATSRGRVDMTVLFENRVLIFEFKVVDSEPDGSAIKQLETMGYAEKYQVRGEPVWLIGIEFSREIRNVIGFEARQL